MKFYVFICFILVLFNFVILEPIVRISNGLIQGAENRTVDRNATYYSFRGIPYALPPINELRFKAPVPANDWNSTLNAVNENNICVQFINSTTLGDEDCLYINVYTPRLPENDTNLHLPVMVWIHGGYFLQGSGNYDEFGPDFFLDEGVVYVSFNYRLGIFGFLSTEDEAAPGNYGLKDQLLALHWVKANIIAFGGDPNNITIFGESAGSASVAYLSQSPLANGLYQKAILQSGSTLCLWAYSRTPRRAAFQVGLLVGIFVRNSEILVNRLRSVPARVLNQKATGSSLTTILAQSPLAGFIFAPTLEPASDEAILTGRSHEILQQHQMNNATYLMGFNSLEGKFFSDVVNSIRLYLVSYDLAPSRLVPIDMNVNNRRNETIVGNIIHQEYFGNELIVFSYESLLEFISDDQFVRPIREMVRLYSEARNVYLYQFTYEGILGSSDRSTPGVGHSEDIYYIFRTSRDELNVSDADLTTRYRMVRLWTNFAKTGNPTPVSDPLLQNITWPLTVTSSDNNVLYLNLGENLLIEENPGQHAVEFYNPLYETYGHPPYDTY